MQRKIYLFLLFSMMLLNACSQNNSKPANSDAKTTLELLLPAEFNTKLLAEKGVLIDLRTASEQKKGIIAGAVLLDFFSDNFEASLAKMDKSKTYFIYCASGGRSSEAAETMFKLGFKHIIDLDGGIKKWKEANLPIQALPN